MDHPASSARHRFGNLDGLRALCIAAVLWHHAPAWRSMADPPQLLSRGFLGVDLFFVLSGFLITTLLLREREVTGRVSLRAFWARRARRILPPYLLVVTAVGAWFVVKGEATAADLLPYYLFLANFLTSHVPLLDPMWSLAVEEQFYLVWPLLLVAMPQRALLPVLGGLVALNVLGAVLPWTPPEAGRFRFGLPNATYAPILLGAAGAVMLHRRPAGGRALLWAMLAGRWAAPALLGGVLAAAAWTPEDVRGWPNLLIHGLMLLLVLSLVVREDSALAPALTWAPVARLGQVSYGIYLYHLVALDVAARLVAGPWATLALCALLSVAMAEASFRTLERFFLQWRRGPGQIGVAAPRDAAFPR